MYGVKVPMLHVSCVYGVKVPMLHVSCGYVYTGGHNADGVVYQ